MRLSRPQYRWLAAARDGLAWFSPAVPGSHYYIRRHGRIERPVDTATAHALSRRGFTQRPSAQPGDPSPLPVTATADGLLALERRPPRATNRRAA